MVGFRNFFVFIFWKLIPLRSYVRLRFRGYCVSPCVKFAEATPPSNVSMEVFLDFNTVQNALGAGVALVNIGLCGETGVSVSQLLGDKFQISRMLIKFSGISVAQ